MQLFLPINDSSELFNSKPMEKKLQKAETQRIIRKNLSYAFSQCISSYMLSEVQDPEEMSFAKPKAKSEREAIKNSQSPEQIRRSKVKKILQAKKNEFDKKVKELAAIVTQKLREIVQSVMNISEKYQTEDDEESKKYSKCSETKSQLNESNKNFLVQLFSEAKLLKSYKGMDRNFPKLVEQAQKAYYGVKSFIKSENLSLKKKSEKQKEKHFAELKQDHLQSYDTADAIFSMKKRHKEAIEKFQQQFKDNGDLSHPIGYECSEDQIQNEILEADYLVLASTKNTKKQQKSLEKDEDGLRFSDFFIPNTSRYSYDESSNQSKQSQMLEYLATTNQMFRKRIQNMMISQGEKQFEIKNKIHNEKERWPEKLEFY